MAIEIERKFLVDHSKWKALPKPEGKLYRQGYISTDPNKTIRVRIAGNNSYLTIKGISEGASRKEFEYEIPLADAKDLLDNFTESELSKTRYKIQFSGKTWEVDVFHNENDGLILAEIELQSETELFDTPGWVTKDVTLDDRYFNSNLSKYPFKSWQK